MVYIFLADGFEEIEGLTVVDLLRRASVDITMVSISGTLKVTGAHKIKVDSDVLFEEADFNNSQMLILPGGMPGTDRLLKHGGLNSLLEEFYSKGKPLAAICAAPKILGEKGFLNGKKATCYPGFEDKLIGAEYLDDDVVCDGSIVTSRGLGTAIDFSLELIKRLKGETEAKRVAESILYRYYKG